MELIGKTRAVYSERVVIDGGQDNIKSIDLHIATPLPDFSTSGATAGWIYIGAANSNGFRSSALNALPSSGDTISLKEPAFVRSAPSQITLQSYEASGDAFGTLTAGPKITVDEIKRVDSEYWARISPAQKR